MMMTFYKIGRFASALFWAGAMIAQQPPQPAPTGPQLLHPIFHNQHRYR
jgi:hypothetical protein